MTLVVRTVLVLWLVVLTVGLVVMWRTRPSATVQAVETSQQRESCAVFFFNYNIRRVAAD